MSFELWLKGSQKQYTLPDKAVELLKEYGYDINDDGNNELILDLCHLNNVLESMNDIGDVPVSFVEFCKICDNYMDTSLEILIGEPLKQKTISIYWNNLKPIVREAIENELGINDIKEICDENGVLTTFTREL